MKECIAILKAADAAARWHVHQKRKGTLGVPYYETWARDCFCRSPAMSRVEADRKADLSLVEE